MMYIINSRAGRAHGPHIVDRVLGFWVQGVGFLVFRVLMSLRFRVREFPLSPTFCKVP